MAPAGPVSTGEGGGVGGVPLQLLHLPLPPRAHHAPLDTTVEQCNYCFSVPPRETAIYILKAGAKDGDTESVKKVRLQKVRLVELFSSKSSSC